MLGGCVSKAEIVGFSPCIAWRHVREHLLSGVWDVFGDDFLQTVFSAYADTL